MRATNRMTLALLGIAAAVMVALLALNAGGSGAQDPPPLGAYMPVAPYPDGTLGPGEWADAATVNFYVGPEQREATLYVGNDETDLYLAVVVEDPGDSGDADTLVVAFDNDAQGGEYRAAGDDGLQQTGDLYGRWFDDTFWYVPPSPDDPAVAYDTIDGGTEDGTGAAVYAGGEWTFELSHPLCSADMLHDFCLSPAEVVGFALRIFDNGVQVGDYPGDPFVPDEYGQIAIQSAAPPPPFVDVDKDAESLACETARIHLWLAGAGQPAEEHLPIDLMLVLDRSGSMDDAGGDPPQPLQDAKDAAKLLVDQLDPANDRVGLVSYATTATLDEGLTGQFNDVKNAIDVMTASGNTNIADGVFDAQAELDANGRAGAVHVMVVLSDGVANRYTATPLSCAICPQSATDCTDAAIDQADTAKGKGTHIFTIGLNLVGVCDGDDAAEALARSVLQSMATPPPSSNYFEAPTSGQLAGILEEIATVVTTIAGVDVTVTEVLPSNLHYVDGSALPAPDSVEAQTLTWGFDLLSIGDEHHITFDVTVDAPGGYNLLMDVYPDSRVEYTDYQSYPQSVPFPETREDIPGCVPAEITNFLVSLEYIVDPYEQESCGQQVIASVCDEAGVQGIADFVAVFDPADEGLPSVELPWVEDESTATEDCLHYMWFEGGLACPPEFGTYTVTATDEYGEVLATLTSDETDHVSDSVPTITYPENHGYVTTVTPTFQWESFPWQFGDDRSSYMVELGGPGGTRWLKTLPAGATQVTFDPYEAGFDLVLGQAYTVGLFAYESDCVELPCYRDTSLRAIEFGVGAPDLIGLSLNVEEEEVHAGAAAVPISDIPIEAIPILSSALAGAPLSSIDIGTSPLSSIPLSSIPLSSIDVAGTPLSSIPLSSIPLSSIGGWQALLAGTALEGMPLQTLTLEDVLALDLDPPLTLADVGLASTSLRSISIASLALGSVPLSSIPLSSIGLDWCTVLADAGVTPCPDLNTTTVLSLDIQGVPLSSIPLSSIPLNSIPLSSIDPNSSPLSSIPLSSIPLSSIPLSSIPLSSIPLSSIDLAGTPLSSIPLSSIALPPGYTDWCDYLVDVSGLSCEQLGVDPVNSLLELIEAFESNGLGSSPLSSIPLSSIPLSSIPLSSIPLSSIPLSSIPLSSIPLSSITIAGTPLSSILLSSIDPPGPTTGVCAYLGGFPGFTCADLGVNPSSTLEDLVDAILNKPSTLSGSPLSSIPLSSIPLSSIPLSSIPLSSIPLSSIPLSSIPLSSITIAGTPLSSIPLSSIDPPGATTDLCQYLGGFPGFSCTDLGVNSSSTLAELFQAIEDAGHTLEASPLSSIPLSSIPLSSIPLSSIPLSSIPLSSIAIGGTPLSSIPLSSIDIASTPLSSIPLSSIPAGIVDCNLVDCVNGTLGDAAAAGAILPGAILGDLVVYDGTTVQDILDALTDPGAVTFFLSFFFGDLMLGDVGDDAELGFGDLTLGDILIALLLSSDFPWEQLPLDEMEVQRFAGTGETLHYDLSFESSGVGPALATSVEVELPDGFLYKPGTTHLDGERFGDPLVAPLVDGSLLTWQLGTVPPGAIVDIGFGAYPGLQLGIFSSSAAVSAYDASVSVENQAPVRVIENFEPNDDPYGDPYALPPIPEPPILEADVLYISHISSGTDVDFFRIPVPAERGSRIAVLMSHLGNDNDLVMYRPAGAPLSSIPLVPVQDGGLDANNAANPLPPETLQDISLESLPLSSISANRGTNDESVQATSMDESGYYTIQVTGYNGSSSPDPYVLRIEVTPPPSIPECGPRSFPFDGDGTPGSIPGTIPPDVNTLFIVNQERLGDMYGAVAAADVMTALGNLAVRGDLGVNGVVIPVEGDPAIAAAYTAWDVDNPCSPYLANDVVNAIATLINDIRTTNPSVRFVVIVGSDEMVPMARVPDLTQLSNESDYVTDLLFAGSNALFGSVATSHVLTDDVYGDIDPIPWLDRELYVPEIAVGRLVETPDEIVAAVDNYIAFGGALDPQTALTTGYDFLSDGAEAVDSHLEAILGPGNTETLISETWTALDLIGEMNPPSPDAPPDIADVNAHYDHYRSLPADQNAMGIEEDLFTSQDVVDFGPEKLLGRTLFSMGCHSGLSISDVLIASPDPGQAERLLDWPQVYAQQGAVYAANTGYGYGDTEAVALSERLMALFAERLNGSMAVGEALTFAKQEYYGGLGVYGVYDEKALVEATFYGLPMYRVGDVAPPPPPPPPPLTDDPITGLQSTMIHTEPTFDPVVTPRGKFYEIGGKVQVTHYRPIQPRAEFDVTQPDTTAHGAIITGLVSVDELPFDAVFARPVIDLGANEPEPEFNDVVFPTAIQNISTLVTPTGQRQRLILILGQYRRDSAGVGVQRLFTSADALVYYSNSSDRRPPFLRRVNAVTSGSVVSFDVQATDATDATGYDPDKVKRVLVLFKEETSDQWRTLDLVQTQGTEHWTGGAPISGGQIGYCVQAVDSAGNVGITCNKASYHRALSLPPELPPEVTLTGDQGDNGWFVGDVTVTITGGQGVLFVVSVDGQPLVQYTGPFAVTGDGIHFVQFSGSDRSTGTLLVRIDTTPPTIGIDTPPEGAVYMQNEAVASSYGCADAGSGVVSCYNPVPSGEDIDTSTLGEHTFQVDATDAAGNTFSDAHSYTVKVADSDGDTILDDDDACPSTPGLADRQGCPVGDHNTVTMHVVDPWRLGYCADGKRHCRVLVEGAEIRVFDRNDPDFVATYGTQYPRWWLYDDIFENAIGQIAECTTDSSGTCTAGEEAVGTYLVIAKVYDAESGKTVYTGRGKSPGEFKDTDGDGVGDLASKHFFLVKFIWWNGRICFTGGMRSVVTGSFLEVVYPEAAVWDEGAGRYVYPLVFNSDSDWSVDVCAEVPEGYQIVGGYDENGNMAPGAECMQTFVSGESKTLAFEVEDVGSPEPQLTANLTLVGPHGNVEALIVDVPGVRETDGPDSTLLAGWNHRLYVGAGAPVEEALAGIMDDVRAVYRLQPDQTFDRWFPGRPDVSTIKAVSPYESLFILMAVPAMWSQEAAVAPPTTIDLLPGWNSVCYAGGSEDVTAALESAAGDIGVIYALAAGRTWERFVPNRPELSSLDRLDRFGCVLIQVTADHGVKWVFDV